MLKGQWFQHLGNNLDYCLGHILDCILINDPYHSLEIGRFTTQYWREFVYDVHFHVDHSTTKYVSSDTWTESCTVVGNQSR